MKYKTIKVRPWKSGSIVVAKVTDFGITEDKEYKVIRASDGFYDCFWIVDDTGEEQEYTDEWFELVSE